MTPENEKKAAAAIDIDYYKYLDDVAKGVTKKVDIDGNGTITEAEDSISALFYNSTQNTYKGILNFEFK